MNLIENDEMWIDCMDEAMSLYTGTSCTNLLIAILCENEVANPWELFSRYHDFLMKDFLYWCQQQQQQNPHELALNDLLCTIQQGWQMKGKTNSDMDLPEPNYNLVQQADLMAELIDPTVDSFFLENEHKLYEEQHSFLNRVLYLLRNDEDGFLFLDAPGGCGKTFVLNAFDCWYLLANQQWSSLLLHQELLQYFFGMEQHHIKDTNSLFQSLKSPHAAFHFKVVKHSNCEMLQFGYWMR